MTAVTEAPLLFLLCLFAQKEKPPRDAEPGFELGSVHGLENLLDRS